MPTVAQIFAHTLKEIGVRYVFGVPSGNMIDYIEALRLEEGIDFILVEHETTAAIMADVCGRITGIPGVCFGTFGPGATNLSTGVGGALLDRSPLIAFTDEMPAHLLSRNVQMNIDHQQLFHPLTKWTTRINKNNVEEIILKAAGIATSEVPGPVHIGVPAGMGNQNVQTPKANVDYLLLEKKKFTPTVTEQFSKAKKHWLKSQKPVLVVGLSAIRYNIKNLLLEVAEKYSCPVVLTPMAKGLFPENHPLYTGVLFHALSNEVAKTYREADLVVAIGYDPVEFNYEQWMPDVPLIHCDTKEADIDKTLYPNVFNVVGSPKIALSELLQTKTITNNWNVNNIEKRKNTLFDKLTSKSNSFGPLAVFNELRKALPEEGILTVDVGAHLHVIGQQWKTPAAQKLIITNGWSAMGFAIPAALAAKLCNPHLPVVALLGDGGFFMTAGALATAKRLQLNIVFIVLVDNSLSLISIKQNNKKYNNFYGTKTEVDIPTAANHYFGVPVYRVKSREEFVLNFNSALAANSPILIEAEINPEEYQHLVLKPNK